MASAQQTMDDPTPSSTPNDLDFGPQILPPPKQATRNPVPPPASEYTNGIFKPLTKRQEDMLNQEYYVKKNMVGRDKLYFSLKRQYGANAPTQKAINDWLQQQKVHQIHKRQFQTKTITPIRNIKKPNQLWQMDLVDMGSKPDNGFKWIITAIDLFSKFAYARPMRNKERRTVVRAATDIFQVAKPRVLQTDNGSEFISSEFQALLRAQGINHITGLAGRAQSQGSIERFHWTMKSVIGKLWSARSKKAWVADLQDIVNNYNKNVHLATGVPPDEINRDDADQISRLNQRQQQVIDRFEQKTAEKEKLLRQQKVWRGDDKAAKGDSVRLKIMKGSIDSATLKPNWSSSIYEIDKVKKKQVGKAVSFNVKDVNGRVLKDTYTATDLQKIQPQRVMRSPITITQREAPRRPATRQQQQQVRLRTRPRRSTRQQARAARTG